MIVPTLRWTTRKFKEVNQEKKPIYFDWLIIHEKGLEGVLENSPEISDHSVTCDEFISAVLMNNDYHWIPTTTLLKKMLKDYPEFVWLEKDYFGNFELCFKRGPLKNFIRKPSDNFPDGIIIESFERALKHAGLEVIQTTHGTNDVKKWRIKEKEKKSKKRDRDNEFPNDEKLKLIKLGIETICKCPPPL